MNESERRNTVSVPYERICLFAGPGAGKSTVAHWLMWKLKSRGFNAEMCREFVKRWAYSGREWDRSIDQPVALGQQLQEVTAALATCCVVIDESPILVQAAYAPYNSDRDTTIRCEKTLQEAHCTLNLVIDRGERPFNTTGRWENRAQAEAKDVEIIALLKQAELNYSRVRHDDYHSIWSLVAGGA